MNGRRVLMPRGHAARLYRGLTLLGLFAWSLHAPASAKPTAKPAPAAQVAPDSHGKTGSKKAGKAVHKRFRQIGRASWYGKDPEKQDTASGESLALGDFTGAHRTLPFGTIVKVTNLHNGRSILVRINDRGPYSGNRIIDVSYAAARELDMARRGVARVRIEVIGTSELASGLGAP